MTTQDPKDPHHDPHHERRALPHVKRDLAAKIGDHAERHLVTPADQVRHPMGRILLLVSIAIIAAAAAIVVLSRT